MNWLLVFLKGFAMGAANVIPGVSGGTVAFITGIYERLINAIKSFDMASLRMLKKKRIGDFIKHVDLLFLMVLGTGVAVSIFTLARVLKLAYAHYEIYTSALFFGLIAVSIFSVAKMVKRWNVSCVFGLLLGCASAVALAVVPQSQGSAGYLYLTVCGAVAMCSMILPGISGSFILLLMGNYMLILNSVNDLRNQHWDRALPIIIPVAIGAVLGVALLSRVLSWLFKRFHDLTTAIITGFVAGSLFIIWPWKQLNLEKSVVVNGVVKGKVFDRMMPELENQETWIAIGFIVAGALIMALMEWFGRKRSTQQSE